MKELKITLRKIVKPASVFFIFLLLASVFNGCNKDETPEEETGNYFMKAKIDGQWIEMKEQKTLQGLAGNNGVQHTAYIEGENEIQQAITIQFFDLEPVGAGTYSGLEVVEGGNFKGVNIGYIFDPTTVYATALEGPVSSGTISVLNENEIKGTFSGIIREPLTGETLTVSAGEFYVRKIK
ncbi:hypothetical protein [Mariniphaga sp.]|uniref:hypothetical protein n=1 Tax=Mariniphaga sp. TaxID=1954475 RepID=UPI0035624064